MSSSLKKTWSEIKDDLPTKGFFMSNFLYHFFLNPKFRLLLNHRIGKYFYFHSFTFLKPIAIYYKNRLIIKRSCDISYHAKIGKKLQLPHPIGIVIGDSVVIEDNVTLFQQVTLGSHGKSTQEKSYPTIKNGAIIYAHTIVIGGITIGEHAKIGAHSLVTTSVPNQAIAFGVPAKIKPISS